MSKNSNRNFAHVIIFELILKTTIRRRRRHFTEKLRVCVIECVYAIPI